MSESTQTLLPFLDSEYRGQMAFTSQLTDDELDVSTQNIPVEEDPADYGSLIEVEIPNDLREAIDLGVGEDMLIIATLRGGKFIVGKSQTDVLSDVGFGFNFPTSSLAHIGAGANDTVTFFFTSIESSEIGSVRQLVNKDNLPIPVDNGWVFLRHYSLTPRSDGTSGLHGRMTIPSVEIDALDVSKGDKLEFMVQNENGKSTFTSKLTGKDGNRMTIVKNAREELGLTPEQNSVRVWVSVESIISASGNTNKSKTATKGDVGVVSGSAIEVIGDESTVDGSSDEADDIPEGEVETPTKIESENVTRPVTPYDVSVDLNPDIVPVVVLDDEERLQEEWPGHYLDEDGNLLCEKEFSDAVIDADRSHADVICRVCARQRPGSLTKHDLAHLLKAETGIEFHPELPFILDKEDATILLMNLLWDK